MTRSVLNGIERVSPPKLSQPADRHPVVTIALSSAPSRTWRQFFRYVRARPPLCYPDLVHFCGDTLAFTSSEQDVETWVQCLDLWIEEANRRCAEYHGRGLR